MGRLGWLEFNEPEDISPVQAKLMRQVEGYYIPPIPISLIENANSSQTVVGFMGWPRPWQGISSPANFKKTGLNLAQI